METRWIIIGALWILTGNFILAQNCADEYITNALIAEEANRPARAIMYYESALECDSISDQDKIKWLNAIKQNYSLYAEELEEEQHKQKAELRREQQETKRFKQEMEQVRNLVRPLLEQADLPIHKNSGLYIVELEEGLRYLVSSDAEIKTFATSIDELTEYTEVLDLSNQPELNLEEIMLHCPRLKQLYICDNKLGNIALQFALFPNLELINLSGNALEQIPVLLFESSQLRELIIENNSLSNLNGDWFNLTQLISLRVNNNNIKMLPNEISNLESLRVLELSGNRFTNSVEQLQAIEGLYELDLSKNSINEIVLEDGQWPMLRILNITETNLSRKNIRKLKKGLPHCTVLKN